MRTTSLVWQWLRKSIALILVYSMVATGVAADTAQQTPARQPARSSMFDLPGFRERFPWLAQLDLGNIPRRHSTANALLQPLQASITPQTRLAPLHAIGASAPIAMLAGAPSNYSSIASNFNGTAIAGGSYIWFNAAFKISGMSTSGTTLYIQGQSVQYTSGSTTYNIAIPNSKIVLSSQVTTATTAYDGTHNQWVTNLPLSFSGNGYLGGMSFQVPAGGLPGGINPVSWSGMVYTTTPGVTVNWQWAAAVYTTFNTDLTRLGIKPFDQTTGSQYSNSDHAGTPENYKSYVTGGARGGGGSNYTGSYSGTASVTPAQYVDPPPTANAGQPQAVNLGATVQLNGTSSYDQEGDPLTYSWAFVSIPTGSTATLQNPTSPTPIFVADKPGSYTTQLVVNDGHSNSSPSQVTISTLNAPPTANAGPNQTVVAGTTVQLDGSGSSDVDGDALTFSWAFVSTPTGSKAVIQNPSSVRPTFVPDYKGNYVVQLTVSDGQYTSTAQATITTTNSAPVANAGPNQSINVATTVQLDGSGSTDVDGDPLTYSWSLVSIPNGSQATISSPAGVKPTFYADLVGDYIAQLIVSDGTASSTATVTISTNDVPPVANAGPAQSVALGTSVTLDGSGSTDSDSLPLTYNWSLTSIPTGSAATLTNPTTVNPTFTVDKAGNYVAQLVVNDGHLSSNPSTVTISTLNSVPVANPESAQTVNANVTVKLDGSSSSDADGDPRTG